MGSNIEPKSYNNNDSINNKFDNETNNNVNYSQKQQQRWLQANPIMYREESQVNRAHTCQSIS